MMRRFLFVLLLVPVLGCGDNRPLSIPGADAPVSGAVRIYFTQPDQPPEASQIAKALVGFIDQTQKTLDVCAFELDNKVITEALVRAVRRGVRVRLVTETDYLKESGVTALQQVGVPVVDDQRTGSLMHNKFMVFDSKTVWTGSMNFTENCAYKNNNNGIYIDNVEIATNYATKFGWFFEQRKFGGLPNKAARIPYPVVTLADGTRIENYFSTHDRPAQYLVDKIQGARQSIHFLAFSFTHKGMGEAMRLRAAAGVPVQGVFEKSQAASSYSEFERLSKVGPNVQVKLDANPRNMHHKVLIIDGAITAAGSFNFSESADKSNDENLLIFHSAPIAQRFEEEFQRLFR